MPNGYERILPPDLVKTIGRINVPFAWELRNRPDAIIIDQEKPEDSYFLEYKASFTPIRKPERVAMLAERAEAGLMDIDIGQWERHAYEIYCRLCDKGKPVAVLYYVPYRPRHLFMDWVDQAVALYQSDAPNGSYHAGLGSGMRYVNPDLRRMRSIEEFFEETHGIPRTELLAWSERLRHVLDAYQRQDGTGKRVTLSR